MTALAPLRIDATPASSWPGDRQELHRPALTRIARAMLGDRHAADDAVQETFVRTRLAAGALDDAALGRYLRTAVRNACRDELRRRRRVDVGLPDDLVDATDGESLVDARIVVDAILAGAPEPDRRLLLARFRAGLEHREVATALGVSEVTARTRLHRALGRARAVPAG